MLVAWCEARQDYRHFRLDRIRSLALDSERYTPSRSQLLLQWRLQHNIPEPEIAY